MCISRGRKANFEYQIYLCTFIKIEVFIKIIIITKKLKQMYVKYTIKNHVKKVNTEKKSKYFKNLKDKCIEGFFS